MNFKFTTYLTIIFSFCFTWNGFSQDWTWWNQKHNWDGHKSWRTYLTLSAGNLGPNALPVPVFHNGTLTEQLQLELGGEYHFHKREQVANGFINLFIPITKNKIGLSLEYIPFEYYKMDTLLRDERKLRDKDGQGIAVGDLYIGTHIQLLRDKVNWPDVLLGIHIKTAAGDHLEAGRFTDTPGYFFDLSFGKNYAINDKLQLRPYAKLGFYSYHMNVYTYLQNDAILYGLGYDLKYSKLLFSNQITGYSGYLKDGDQPLVFRLRVKYPIKKRWNLEFRYQYGIKDFEYHSLRVGGVYQLRQ